MRKFALLLVIALVGCSRYNSPASGPVAEHAPASTTQATTMGNQRRSVYYTGSVQGVGFRASVVMLSRGFDVAGEVRNLPDGRVELIVEGPPAVVERFLQRVAEHFEENIRKVEQNTSSAQGLSPGIRIVY